MPPQQPEDVKDLATNLLELEAPWLVEKVVIDKAAKTMTVHVEHQYMVAMACPECGGPSPRGTTVGKSRGATLTGRNSR